MKAERRRLQRTGHRHFCSRRAGPGSFICSTILNTTIITVLQRVSLLGCILLVTGAFCAWPHFHPETVLGLRYYRALDATFHGGYFFVITFLLYLVASPRTGMVPFCGMMLVLSGVLEGVQAWVPGRSFSVPDLAANAAGVCTAMFLHYLIHKIKHSLLTSKYSK